MIAVFLIYGLAFFSLGLIIAIYPRRHSKFQLAKNAWLVAAFGILHGLNEWADMFLIIQRPFETAHLQIIRSVLLPVSFVFLLLFGIKSLPGSINRHIRFGALPIILIVLWILIVLTSSRHMLMADIGARYLLAAPGIALT